MRVKLRLTVFVATAVVAAFACAGFGSSSALATPANLLFALPDEGQVLAVGPDSAVVDIRGTSHTSSLEVIGPGTATPGPVLKHPVQAAISPNGGYVAWSVSTCPAGSGEQFGGTESYNGPAEIFVAKADDLSEPVQVEIPDDFNAGGRAQVFAMKVSDSGGVAAVAFAESLGPGHRCIYSGPVPPPKAKFGEALLSAAPSATRFSVISGVPVSDQYDGFPSSSGERTAVNGFAFCNGHTAFEVNSDSLAVTRTPFSGPCAFVSTSGDVFGPEHSESGHWVEPVAASGRYRVARIDASDKDELDPLTQPLPSQDAPELSPSGNQTILVNNGGDNETSTDLYDVNAQSGRTTTIPVAGPMKHRFIEGGFFLSNHSVLVVGYPSYRDHTFTEDARLAVYNLSQRRWGPVLGIHVGGEDTQVCPLPSGSALFLSWNDEDDGKIDLINAGGSSVLPIRTSSLGSIADQSFYPDQQICTSTQILLATVAPNLYSIALSAVDGTAWTPASS